MFINNGNIGIGVINPNAQLQLSNTKANRRIVLWEDINNDFEYYGFGVNSGVLRFNVGQYASHAFYAAFSSNADSNTNQVECIFSVNPQGTRFNSPIISVDQIGGKARHM